MFSYFNTGVHVFMQNTNDCVAMASDAVITQCTLDGLIVRSSLNRFRDNCVCNLFFFDGNRALFLEHEFSYCKMSCTLFV